MTRAYLLGLATLPALALLAALLFVLWVRAEQVLDRRGYSVEAAHRRQVAGTDLSADHEQHWDYTLRNGIWWERSWGPIFAGGWYREPPKYCEPSPRLIGRWIGIGRTSGPSLSVIRTEHLSLTA